MPCSAPLRTTFAVAVVASLASVAEAAAETSPNAAPTPTEPVVTAPVDAEPSEGEKTGGKKKKKKKELAAEAFPEDDNLGAAAPVELRGRAQVLLLWEDQTLYNRIDDSTQGRDRLNFDVTSARLATKVKIVDKITAVVEAEFADKVDLKDGYVQWKTKHAMVRVGQFKMPLSAFTLESPWTLPLARRGALQEQLADNLLLFGRRVGVMGQWKGSGSVDPSIVFGVFESQYLTADDTAVPKIDKGDAVRDEDLRDLTFVGRASISPGPAEIAAVAQYQTNVAPTLIDGRVGRSLAGAEATVDSVGESTGFRLWAEAYYGQSVYDDNLIDLSKVGFVTGRAMAAWRLAGLTRGERYFEGFATFGALDPDLDESDDLFWEAMVGFNIGHWKQTRLTLQYEHFEAKRNFNVSGQMGLGGGNIEDVLSHNAVVMQVGAAF